MSHKNNGYCEHCLSIANRYPKPNEALFGWFLSLQKAHPEAHISCFGRGKQDQEELFIKGATRAHFGHSAHNFNAAIDLFRDEPGHPLYERKWFLEILRDLPHQWLEWYGSPGAQFYELPHLQLRDFKDMAARGELELVEKLV